MPTKPTKKRQRATTAAAKDGARIRAYRLPGDLLQSLDAYRRKLEAEDPDRVEGVSESEAIRKALRRFFREQGIIKP